MLANLSCLCLLLSSAQCFAHVQLWQPAGCVNAGESDAPQGVVNTSDGRVVRAFHRFTLVDQTGQGRDLTKGRRRDQVNEQVLPSPTFLAYLCLSTCLHGRSLHLPGCIRQGVCIIRGKTSNCMHPWASLAALPAEIP